MHPDEQVRQTEVSVEISRLHNKIDELKTRASILFTRLKPVSNPKPKNAVDNEKKMPACALSKELDQATSKLSQIVSMINDQIEDLEI